MFQFSLDFDFFNYKLLNYFKNVESLIITDNDFSKLGLVYFRKKLKLTGFEQLVPTGLFGRQLFHSPSIFGHFNNKKIVPHVTIMNLISFAHELSNYFSLFKMC